MLSVAVFLVSLALPAVLEMKGWFFAVGGFVGVTQGHVGWFANIAYPLAFGFLLIGQPSKALRIGLVAVLLALSSMVSIGAMGIPRFPGQASPVTPGDFGAGFFMWISSIGLVVIEAWRLQKTDWDALSDGHGT